MSSWPADDQISARYPLYTRGNVGEVFPTVVSPLTWSLYGAQAEMGWRDAFAEFGALQPSDYGDEPMVILGVFGGYCYINIGIVRVFAVRTPGLTVEQMDTQIFGEADAPKYRPEKGHKSLLAPLRVARTILKTLSTTALPELEEDKDSVRDFLARLPDPASASDEDLVQATLDFRPLFRHLFRRHIFTSFRATVPTGVLAQIGEKVGDPGLPIKLLGGIGSVESAEPSHQLWDLGRMVAGDPHLTSVFDGGLGGLKGRLSSDPSAEEFCQELDRFRAEYGHRGPNEWETSSATWGTDASLVLAAIDALRRADPAHDPHAQRSRLATEAAATQASVRGRLGRVSQWQFDKALTSAAVFSQGRERSKTTVIRAIHGIRLVQRALAARGRDRGGPPDLEDFWLLSIDEVAGYLRDPASYLGVLAERRSLKEKLASLEPPFIVDGKQPPIDTWRPRTGEGDEVELSPGAVLTGIRGCPGVARGRARVVLDPGDPRGLGPGDVLVAPITDPAWTPLFLSAEAVVVDVGAAMSHAVIVSRELGIPCVVSVTGATTSIPDGAEIEVDGNSGTVRVL